MGILGIMILSLVFVGVFVAVNVFEYYDTYTTYYNNNHFNKPVHATCLKGHTMEKLKENPYPKPFTVPIICKICKKRIDFCRGFHCCF